MKYRHLLLLAPLMLCSSCGNKDNKMEIPVYLGEYGCSMRDKNDTRRWKFHLYWLEYVTKAALFFSMNIGLTY